MTPTEKDIIWEAVVLMDAARKNASSLVAKLTKDVFRADIVTSMGRVIEDLAMVRKYLDDIHKMKKPIISTRPDYARELRESEQAMIDKASCWKPD